jgi:hypothetical protein
MRRTSPKHHDPMIVFGLVTILSPGRRAKPLWWNIKRAVELAGHILEGDQAGQFDDRFFVEVRFEPRKRFIVNLTAGERHGFCEFEGRAFFFAEKGVVALCIQCLDLFLRHAPLEQCRRVNIDTKRTMINLRYPDGHQRSQGGIKRRSLSVDHPIENRQSEKQFRRTRPHKCRIEHHPISPPLSPK